MGPEPWKLYQGLRRKGKAGKELGRGAESKNSASTLSKIGIKMCEICRNIGLGWELRKEGSVFSFQGCVSLPEARARGNSEVVSSSGDLGMDGPRHFSLAGASGFKESLTE